ncbi:Top2 [Symbiodinium sp. CCMP2592]|nr:Top2 [Symbiodinium sp. CCMP2592]
MANASHIKGREGKSIEQIYQKKTQLEHILLRPDTYVGSTEAQVQDLWVFDGVQSRMVHRKISFVRAQEKIAFQVPALYKIFDEILVNAADNLMRDPQVTLFCSCEPHSRGQRLEQGMDTIKVEIDQQQGLITVWNNGRRAKGVVLEVARDGGYELSVRSASASLTWAQGSRLFASLAVRCMLSVGGVRFNRAPPLSGAPTGAAEVLAGFPDVDMPQHAWSSTAQSTKLLQDRRVFKLERFLSKAGVLSRREAARRVKAGHVTVNQATVWDPFHAVHVQFDEVEVQGFGKVVLPDWDSTAPRLVLFNKPTGVVTSLRPTKSTKATDQHLPALQDALPGAYRELLAPHVPALRPVGRLDVASAGLLLLTDSSDMVNQLTGPNSCEKEYLVSVTPVPNDRSLRKLREGVSIRDGNAKRGMTLPCAVTLVRSDSSKARTPRAVLRFAIREGRNRQIRRMCKSEGLMVEWLLRTRIGPVRLGDLAIGAARDATKKEQKALTALTRA